MVYNEAFIALIGDKHPAALGRPVHEVAPESFHVVGPMLHAVLAGEPAVLVRDVPVPLHRRGFLEECHFTFSYSLVRGPGGAIGGVMSIVTETTDEVVARRRCGCREWTPRRPRPRCRPRRGAILVHVRP